MKNPILQQVKTIWNRKTKMKKTRNLMTSDGVKQYSWYFSPCPQTPNMSKTVRGKKFRKEYLSQVAPTLPPNARPQLGPDATGVGWVYLYALVDRTGQHDLSQLRSLQDWFLKYELQTVPGVSEVSALGGMVKQYQVRVHPDKLRAFNIPLSHIQMAIQRGNQEVGASVVEMAEAEYMVRASGYIQGRDDLANIPLGLNVNGTPLLLKDVADIEIGQDRRLWLPRISRASPMSV